ncbi:hypothetical protein [Deinococcus sp.]|uniref:hypothetical protein n=1 Tax=Deinococcus sp. TaxID=47478 RepID=UPI003CC5AD6D
MTQLTPGAQIHRLPAPQPMAGETWVNFLSVVARMWVAAEDASASQLNVQVVSRLDATLRDLKAQGKITHSSIGGWYGNEIQLAVSVPDHLYWREHRQAVRQTLQQSVQDLDVYVNAELDADTDNGDA